ncbi:MAG: ABC transporter substrate-binding protein [Bryobacteraceae bacterium]
MSKRLKYRIWFSFLLAVLFAMNAPAQQKITINYPNRSGSNWPLFLAKDGGYYQKYGLDVTLTFGVMPAGVAMLVSGEAQMVNSSLEQLMQAASKDGSLVLVGSALNRAAFALMAAKNIGSIKDLKGKRIAVSQVGDAPYGYLIALLSKNGLSARDVQWIPVGTDVNGRAAALTSGRAEATLLTAPAYFKLGAGFQDAGESRRASRDLRLDRVLDEEERGGGRSAVASKTDPGADGSNQALLRRQGIRCADVRAI